MNRTDLERLVRDVRTIAERLPHGSQMGASERRAVSVKVLALCAVVQERLDKPSTVAE